MNQPIQKLAPQHEAIMDWLIANPTGTLQVMGEALGYTVPWLSRVINSDLFRMEYMRRRGDIVGRLDTTIVEKMEVLAHITLDKLADQVASAESVDVQLQVADKMLNRLGYPTNRGVGQVKGGSVNVQQNFIVADRDSLAAARSMMARVTDMLPAPVVEAEPQPALVDTLTMEGSFDYVVTNDKMSTS